MGKYPISKQAGEAIKRTFWDAERYSKAGAPHIAKRYAANELYRIARLEYARIVRERLEAYKGKKIRLITKALVVGIILRRLRTNPTEAQKRIVGKIIDGLIKKGMEKSGNEK